ncbi:MAG: hypothetical protein ACLQU2_00720 [Candidatus Binataceae bacterium]
MDERLTLHVPVLALPQKLFWPFGYFKQRPRVWLNCERPPPTRNLARPRSSETVAFEGNVLRSLPGPDGRAQSVQPNVTKSTRADTPAVLTAPYFFRAKHVQKE